MRFKEFIAPEPNVFEALDISEEEGKQNHSQPHDPPAILIMRRKSIRQFPNGQKVAMYHIDKLNKYVTIPYNSLEWSTLPEDTEKIG